MKLYKLALVELVGCVKTPAKRSQHFKTTYRNIVGCNILRVFGQQEPACPNISQQGGQTRTTCCAQQ